jgi:hypothetical protein
MRCTKCGTEVPESARFCTRCHATLRFECPACHHLQRQGGSCDECGVDFMKYLSSVIAIKKVEAEHQHARNERRSWFVKQILYFPITGGLHLLKDLFRRKDS